MGRHTVGLEQARSYCATPSDELRAKLWTDFEMLTRMVRGAVGAVPACWLSGSFFSDKEEPGDIDVVYLLAHDDVEGVDDDGRRMLNLLCKRRVQEHLGLSVDAYYLDWWARPGINRGEASVRPGRYLENRGYWDDLWSRYKDPVLALDKIPRRGYLEVILDGYERS